MFFNFEKVSSNIIESEIQYMDDCNTLRENGMEEEQMNLDHFLKNLYHGSIATVFIVNLFETSLNTILTRRLAIEENEILKASHTLKLQLICKIYNVDFAKLKSDHSYEILQLIIKLRNDITHFKTNDIGDGHYLVKGLSIPLGTTKKYYLEDLFSKSFIEECYHGTIKFLSLLCDECGLLLNKNCEIIDSDGTSSLCEFIIDKSQMDD